MGLLVASVLVVLLSSALASCTEVALFSASVGAIRNAVDNDRRGAASLLTIKSAMARPVMAIVILNNVSNIVGSIAVGAIAADTLGSGYLGVFSGGLTLAVIIFAEIIPKTVGEQYALRIALFAAPILVWLTRALLPLIVLVELLLKPFISTKPITSESEIRALATIGTEEGVIDHEEGKLIQRVFRLNDITARAIMTPAPRVDWLDGSRTLDAAAAQLKALTHTRLPVVQEGDLERIVGIVSVRDLLVALTNGEGDRPVAAYAQKADFLPGTMTGDNLLRHFQHSQRHLGVVVDALGTVLGVVTLEDVVEELVGEIVDETDVEEIELRVLEDGGVLCKAALETRKVAKELGVKMPEGKRVSEWLLEALGRIPTEGEVLVLDGIEVTIADATPRRLRWVELRVVTD